MTVSGTMDAAAATGTGSSAKKAEQAPPADGQRPSAKKGSGKRHGKQPGSLGHGPSQKPEISTRREHWPEVYAACGAALSEGAASQAYTAWDEVDIAPAVEGPIGLTISATRQAVAEGSCSCGHVRRALPWRAHADGQWQKAELGEWRPEGRHLAGVIVLRALSMRLSRARIRELLMKLLELALRTGVIAENIQEAVRASLPLENTLQGDLSDLLISDGYFV